MTGKSPDGVTDTLEKLKTLLERGEIKIFTPSEVKTIRSMIVVYESFAAFGRVGIWLRNIALFVGSIFIIYAAAKSGLSEFLKGLL